MKKVFYLFCIISFFVANNNVIAQNTICSNPKCHGGKIYCTECDMSGEIKCPDCRGTGKVLGANCTRCNGKRVVTCPKCNGEGTYPCPECNGNGVIGNSNNNSNNDNSSHNHNDGNITNIIGNDNHSPHKHTCPECKGEKEIPVPCPNPNCHNGAIYCEECNYTGKVKHECSVCKGEGVVSQHRKITCAKCKGEKYVEVVQEKQEKCPYCTNGKRPGRSHDKHGHSVYVTCSYCNGEGTRTVSVKTKVPCDACRGFGYKIEREPTTVTCESCQGNGYVYEKCTKCDGKGCYPCPTCKGYANIREKCPRCKGTGVIYTE